MANKVGFLLGAGASYELGIPLVDELTIEFKKAILTLSDTSYYNVPKGIRTILFPLLKDSILHYEDIVWHIEVEINRTRNKELY